MQFKKECWNRKKVFLGNFWKAKRGGIFSVLLFGVLIKKEKIFKLLNAAKHRGSLGGDVLLFAFW